MKYFIALIICIPTFIVADAQPGTLDKSFSEDGKIISETYRGNDCNSTAIQNDGKIIVAGSGGYDVTGGFLLVRYNSDGTIDNSFGNEGRVITDFSGAGTSSIESVAILPDGKIIATGWYGAYTTTNIDIVLLQYKPDGSIDSSFGVNGIVVTDIAKDDYVYDMVMQPDGKIIVAGNRVKNENDNQTSFVVRYMPDGSLDNSFGKKGIVLTTYNTNTEITSISLQSDNKIIIGGNYFGIGNEYMLVRFRTDGSVDSSFGINGLARLSFGYDLGDYAQLFDITVQRDGKIIAIGNNGVFEYHLVVARFTANGAVDSSFGGGKGYTSSFFEEGSSAAGTALVQEDGKIIVTGAYYNEIGYFVILRLKENGVVDSSFGENGITLTSFEGITSLFSNSAAIQQDGKVVQVGNVLQGNPSYYYYAIARYNNVEKQKQPEFAKIQKWQGHYGFTWDDWPGNKTTHYSVSRSIDASTFNEIAQVPDVNGKKKYQFEDPAPLNGTVYYRLTAVRSDGKNVNSNIVITWNASAIKLFPNPAKNSLQLQGLSATEKTKLTVVDLSGNTKTTATTTGSNYTINIAQLKPGNYMLRMETNGEIVTRMFVKE